MLKKKNQLPKITVITVVYNSEETIERTIKSVLSQSYSNLEYIIVYTPSQDKTFDIIKKYKTKIDKVILCEKRGIYLNMNVAIKSASGKYINFMNSGDRFNNIRVISKIFNYDYNKYDIIYGNCKMLYGKFTRNVFAQKPETINYQMFFTHQSCFVRTAIHKKYYFNLKYKYSADYEFFVKNYLDGKIFKLINIFISKRSVLGASDINKESTLFETLLISYKYFKRIDILIFLLYKIFFYNFTKILRNYLPKNIFLFLFKLKLKIFN
jgi:glycosyltransferase involved in cell wall biosynthesis